MPYNSKQVERKRKLYMDSRHQNDDTINYPVLLSNNHLHLVAYINELLLISLLVFGVIIQYYRWLFEQQASPQSACAQSPYWVGLMV